MSQPIQIGMIIEGHFNKVIDKVGLLPDETKKMSDLRFADCLLCAHTPRPNDTNTKGPGLRDNKYCNACGCDMEAKTTVKEATCPIGRW